MAVSLEVRVPFVDHELVEHVLAVPADLRCAGVPDKPYEWELAAPVLGADHPRRAKQGFIFPFERWLREGKGGRAVREGLTSPARLAEAGLRPDGVARVMAPFLAGSAVVPWSRPWALHVLLEWCARHRARI
jgi:asparagine synthase (glutamine-hydrolysing)